MTAELLKMVASGAKAQTSGLDEGTERLRLIHFTMVGDKLAHPFEAIDYYRQQIERHPQRAEYHMRLGNVYRFLGRWAKAEAEYEQALSLDPSDASTLACLGGMASLQGDAERALAYYEAYLEQVPDRPGNEEDGLLWDQARDAVWELRGEKVSLPRRTVSPLQDELPSSRPSGAPDQIRERIRPSTPRSARSSQARKKRKRKRKAARRTRRRKR